MFPHLTDFVSLSILTPIKNDAKETPVEPNDIIIIVNNADKEEKQSTICGTG